MRSVPPVDKARERLGANDQCMVDGAGANDLRGHIEAAHPASASRTEVEGSGVGGTQRVLHQTGGGRKEVVEAGAGYNDQIQSGQVQIGHVQCLAGSRQRLGGSVFVFGRNTPLADTGATDNPFIIGIHHLSDVGIGTDFFRHVHAPTTDLRITQPAGPAVVGRG